MIPAATALNATVLCNAIVFLLILVNGLPGRNPWQLLQFQEIGIIG
jgi:hypothetical protein